MSLKHCFLILIIFLLACGRAVETPIVYHEPPPPIKMMVPDMENPEPLPFDCSRDRIDPSKTIESTRGQVMGGEHEIFYDCKLETYCVRYHDGKTGFYCIPYFITGDWLQPSWYSNGPFNAELYKIYSAGTYYSHDGKIYTRATTRPLELNPGWLVMGFNASKVVEFKDFFKFEI